MTFAQTWDVGYGTEEQAAPRQLTTSSSPRLAPQCTGSLTQTPQYPPDADATRETLLSVGPEAARGARDFTHRTFADWQLDELMQEAVLIASELVTNAIRHGQFLAADGSESARVALAWQRHAGRVICTVTDRSPRPPVLGSADRDAESGRGLQVVQALAATWGWIMLGATSKAVWAALIIPR